MKAKIKKLFTKTLLVLGVIILIAQYGIACYIYLDNFHMVKMFSDITSEGHEISVYQQGQQRLFSGCYVFYIYVYGEKILNLYKPPSCTMLELSQTQPYYSKSDIACTEDNAENYEIIFCKRCDTPNLIFSSDFSSIKYIRSYSYKIYKKNIMVEISEFIDLN